LANSTLPSLAVYFDEEYPSSWIGKSSASYLAQTLESRGYALLSSSDLGAWMEQWIRIGIPRDAEPTVVFSQDIAPRTIAFPPTAECLVRSFLDHGGRVVWLGDIPFFWITKEEKGDEEKVAKERTGLAGARVLGVVSTFAFPLSPVRLTRFGKRIGLRSPWSGLRPVVAFRFNPRNLGSSRNLFVQPSLPTPIGIGERSWTRGVRAKLDFRVLRLESPEDSISQDLPEESKQARLASIRYFKRWELRNAWLQQYSRIHPNSGFLRVWDCPIAELTHQMIDEVDSIARAKWSSLRRALFLSLFE
jgi:hypothetical protein